MPKYVTYLFADSIWEASLPEISGKQHVLKHEKTEHTRFIAQTNARELNRINVGIIFKESEKFDSLGPRWKL